MPQSSAILVNRIVIINLRCLQSTQKRSRGNQFIHRRLTKTKSMVFETVIKECKRRGVIKIGFINGDRLISSEGLVERLREVRF